MKLTFIGTGSGKTSLLRYHSSILIETGRHKILVDCGDGISRALLANETEFNSIDTILFSHYHADHFSGISSLITQMKLYDRKEPLTVFTNKNLISALKDFLTNTYLFKESLPFEISFKKFESGEKIKVTENFSFTAKQNSHIRNKYGINYVDENMFVSSSFLFEENGKKIIYTADVGSGNDLFLFDETGVDLLITETTHISPGSISEADKKLKAGKIFLTHISDEDEEKLRLWLKNTGYEISSKTLIAEDGHFVIL